MIYAKQTLGYESCYSMKRASIDVMKDEFQWHFMQIDRLNARRHSGRRRSSNEIILYAKLRIRDFYA